MTESIYEAVGGHEAFNRLVSVFYQEVSKDPELRALYPEEDLGPAEERLRMFLEQYWGGPGTYSERRGHPRLRMRHAPFAVTFDMRDRWLKHMATALDSLDLDPLHRGILWDYFERAAHSLVNSTDGRSPLERASAPQTPDFTQENIGPADDGRAGGKNGLGFLRPKP